MLLVVFLVLLNLSAATQDQMSFRVILAGASGETGRVVLRNLLDESRISKVTTIGRRESTVQHEKLEHQIVNFEELPEDVFKDHDVAICTLGTTRSKAGSEGFIKVDRDYILGFAERSKAAGVRQFHLMSSQGANAGSYFLYTQIKGQVDEKVLSMGFEEKTVVYRPSVLLCDRQEARMMERPIRWLLGWADRGRAISVKVEDVAKAMVLSIFDDTKGIVDNRTIVQKAAAAALADTQTPEKNEL